MFPVLFRIGPFTLHTYGLLVAAGFALALFYASRQASREGLSAEKISNFFFVIVVAAIAGSRLLYVAFNWDWFLDHPLRILAVWEGGLVFHGGLILAVSAGWVYLRISELPMWRTADLSAPAIALGQAVGRLGCLAAGCCFGRVTDLPWGITFLHPEALAPREVPLHPTQLYSSLSNAAVFLILHLYRGRRPAEGRVFWLYLVLASSARFVEDFFRGEGAVLSLLPFLTATQFIALLAAAAGLGLFVLFGRKGKDVFPHHPPDGVE